MKNRILVQNLKTGSSVYTVKNEHLTLLLCSFNQNNIDANIRIRLVSPGANATIIGIIVASGVSIMKLHTLQEHISPDTTSNLLIKTALYDTAQCNIDGGIRVEKNAQKTDAYQRNENLLMSPKTHAESKPSLEILADDVRCTHGATVGPVSEEELWYLATRGIAKGEAERLIVRGFFGKALEKLEDESVKQQVQKSLEGAI